jgi:deoxycytidylate deaminase
MLLAAGIKKIKYINNYRNDELVMDFTEMMGVSLQSI